MSDKELYEMIIHLSGIETGEYSSCSYCNMDIDDLRHDKDCKILEIEKLLKDLNNGQ